MANSLPWSVRGIDPDIREQAVEAAHRSGLSVGQWLNQVLAGSLDDEDEAPEEEVRPRRAARRRNADDRMERLGERLGRLGQRRTATAAHRFAAEDDEAPVLDLLQEAVEAIERIERRQVSHAPARPDARPDAVSDNLRAFEAKLDQLLRQREEAASAAAPAPAAGLESRLAGIMSTLERMQAQSALPVVPSTASAPARFADEDPAFARALAEIETRRRNLDGETAPRRRTEAVSEAPRAPQEDSGLAAMRSDLARLATRIDELRVQQGPSEEVSAVRRELAQVSASLEQLSPQRLVGLVEHAVAGLADKFERAPHAGLPLNLAEPLERVHEDVRAVLREVSEARGTEALTREVSNIARRLDQISAASSPAQIGEIAAETAAIKQLVNQAMRAQPLEGLAHQIEQLARQVDRFQRNPASFDDRALMDAIREVSDRLERLDPRSSFASLETRLAAVSNIEEKLGEIVSGMKKLAKDAQPLPKLDSISERLERIDRALDSTKANPLAGLDQLTARLDKIGSALDKVSSAPAKGQDEALLNLMERLSQRMEQVSGAGTDTKALDQLQREIAGLARRMENVGGAPSGLDGIERSVNDLFTQFDQTRRDMREIAESAASRAAEQALKAGGTAGRDPQAESLAAEGLLLIKRDLNEFKAAQGEAEARTRQTLEQVQSTLSTLIGRLGEAETRMVKAASAPRMEVAPARSEPAPRLEAPVLRAEPSARNTPVEGLDLPLEPGMEPGLGSGLGQQPAIPAQPMPTPEGLSADPRANFIAAARRAAQAAAEKSQSALGEGKEAPAKSGRLAAKLVGGRDAGTSFIVKARKPILLGLAAIVFSMGALKVVGSRNQAVMVPPSPKPMTTMPEIEQRPMERKADEPENTGSVAPPASTSEAQPIPGVNAPSIGQAHFSTKTSKRGQRLSETASVSQTDPVTVGSIGSEGNARPVDSTRAALTELASTSNLKGIDSLRDAAVGGNVPAMFEIGARLADGRGMTRDAKLAARWFEQAAVQGHGPSQYRLASLYREGRGINKDSNLAFQWFDRAAAQGHVLAMHNAAVLLAEGVHGTPDYAGAALWFKRAAEHGIKDSQFNVAILYARGLGVNQDLAESYRWFSIAANQGDIDAGKKRDDIAARLSKEQLSTEIERVKAFKPAKPAASANEPGTWEAVARRS